MELCVYTVHVCVGMCGLVYMYTSPSWLCLLKGPGSNDSSTTMRAPGTPIMVSKHLSPTKGTRAPWKSGYLVPGMEGKYKMILAHLVAPE